MKIISEKTGKEYASVEACLAAEKTYEEEQEAKRKEAEKALAERKAKEEIATKERKAAADEVDKARQAMVEATKAYRAALSKFCEKYGAYHRTYRYNGNARDALNFFDNFFDFWF